MLTLGLDTVDGGLAGLWVTVSDLARQKGISKQAASKRIDRLESQGLLKTKPGERGAKLVNLAQFNKVTADTTDGIREINGKSAAGPSEAPEEQGETRRALIDQQTRRAAYDADLKQLELEEKLGRLLPVEDVEQSMVRVAESMVRVIDQMPLRADELANAVAKEGSVGARGVLKAIARDLRDQLAKNLKILGKEDAGRDDEPDA